MTENEGLELRPTEAPQPDPGNSDPEAFTAELSDEEVLEAQQRVEEVISTLNIQDGGTDQ